jgi:hypothetical protein
MSEFELPQSAASLTMTITMFIAIRFDLRRIRGENGGMKITSHTQFQPIVIFDMSFHQ